ncbi:MAG: hypothetical protein DI630_34295 [Gordonia sp. (in: high G+C Gram-positive bacteria)]|nr:MAG: hypothetical protein DI630_34295 [Gordonia sp. (in: high G+C Gram-positive bacteria)]
MTMQKIYAVSFVPDDDIWAYFFNPQAADAYIEVWRTSTDAQVAQSEVPGSIDALEVRELSLFEDPTEVSAGYSPILELQP